ncbi:DENN domain-containing protein 11-like isoform X2 [Salvelinus namaycush]|uniref:DENN domain-containing protein 11 n=1 Tax=Salvelinus namaycush TaxID=8040 RepID=A0A8U1BYA4_SALNM|nr:DENN domain-containing protein 11-like isoform X2 [Salvelinus namaycush]
MVEQSDRAPLLDWEEISPAELTQAVPSPAKEHGWESSPPDGCSQGITAPGIGWSTRYGGRATVTAVPSLNGSPSPDYTGPWDVPSPINADPGISLKERVGWEEKDQIVSVFVVTFDTRSGNMVEWCLPQDVNLDGVEFKSMASGSHRISNDFIYFRKGCYFGLACFANMPVESELERGARMKSVGILSPSYTLLYHYMHFLENQVRHQLQCPGSYSPLEAFYEDKKAVLHPAGNGLVTACPTSYWVPAINRCMHPEMKITHPAGCMSQFICFFGEQILVLWKFALLRKRILMFSPPPVGVVCYRGTTENIFEEKKELYDVYVDNQNVKTHRDSMQPLLRLNGADREKYRKLSEQRQMLHYTQEVDGDCTSNEEDLFILFFMEQNNRIFQTLSEVEASADHTLTAEHVRAMGLDPQADRTFLEDLLEVYGIDVMLVIDNPCCP